MFLPFRPCFVAEYCKKIKNWVALRAQPNTMRACNASKRCASSRSSTRAATNEPTVHAMCSVERSYTTCKHAARILIVYTLSSGLMFVSKETSFLSTRPTEGPPVLISGIATPAAMFSACFVRYTRSQGREGSKRYRRMQQYNDEMFLYRFS